MTGMGTAAGTVLVGVDGSDPAMRAVRWAAAEAARRRVPLRVVSAFGPAPAERYGARLGEVLLNNVHELVTTAVAHARGAAPEVTVTGEILTEHAIPWLVAQSRRAGLVVLGDRGQGGLTGLLVGSVAMAVATHAACPVVVVRGPEPDATSQLDRPLDRPVVVGVGEPPDSDPVLAFAFEAAAARRAPLTAVHVWRLPALLHPDAALLVDWHGVATQESRALADAVAPWVEKFPEVPVEQVVVKGIPTYELVERTTSAQLVVVGTRGHGSLAGMFLGSVSHALLHHASCPVVVVRPAATAEDHEWRSTA